MNEARAKPSCRHCGNPLTDDRSRQSGFCCSGCAYVYRMVNESGLAGYYSLKDNITPPADPSIFQPRDFSWLKTLQEQAETEEDKKVDDLSLSVQGISCAGCVWLIERLFLQLEGARGIVVNAQTGELRLRWARASLSLPDFALRLQSFGYVLGPPGEQTGDTESRGLVRRIGLCAAFSMNVMLFTLPVYFGMEPNFEYARLFSTITLAFATLSLLVGGTHFLGRALRSLREGVMHIDLPIAIGILGAYCGSFYGWLSNNEAYTYFDFVSVFILLMLIGRWAQVAAVERNQRQLLRQQLKPPQVLALDKEGRLSEQSPESLRPGQAFELRPGQTCPVDAQLSEGEFSFSLASINGESDPRLFRAGELVPSGAINISLKQAKLEARQPWSESLLARLLGTGDRPGWRHRLLERIIRGYLIAIFITALGSGLFWWFHSGDLLQTGSVVTAVLVVSCPCAIGLAYPLAEEIAAVALRRRGVFIRENDLWGKLPRVKRLVFDKTGTLTLETPELANPEALAALEPAARQRLYTLVRDSAHPLSVSLRSELLARGNQSSVPSTPREQVGMGIELSDAQGRWALGKPGWAAPGNEETTPAGLGPNSTVFFSHEGRPLARFIFTDRIRGDVPAELASLRREGFEIFILSGDHPAKVQTLAKELGLSEEAALGGLNPEAKAAWIEKSFADRTLMLGDGANDSLAFDRALCRGTPVVHRGILELKADFFYLGRGIAGIRALFEADRIRRRVQVQILAFSIGYNLLAVGLAVAGHMNPLLAAVLMPLNSLLGLSIVVVGMRKIFQIKSP